MKFAQRFVLPLARLRESLRHVGYYQSELIALHPFHELNGRITRLFFDLIAIFNGYAPIDYSKTLLEQPMNAYVQASIVCAQQADQRQLYQII